MQREGSALTRAADPLNVSPATANPIAEELRRLGVDLTLPNARIAPESGRVLARDEEQQVKQTRGRAVRASLEALFSDPGYATLDDDTRRRLVLNMIRQGRTQATRRLREELP